MIITSITQQKKDPERVNIFVDYEYTFSLTKNQLIENKLHKNREITEAEIENFKKLSKIGKEKANAMKLITSRPRSRKEVFDYLTFKRSVDPVEAEGIIKSLEEMNYINDLDFASWFVEQRKMNSKYGINKIKAQLATKGISSEIAKHAISTIDSSDQLEKIIKFLEKELDGNYDIDYDYKAKLTRKLASRGFSFDLIKEGFSKLKN